MATRGWDNVTVTDIARMRACQAKTTAPTSKYRNVRFSLDGFTFDSKREASYYVGLKARAHNGEITELRVHPTFPLMAPTAAGVNVEVSQYEADFTYRDADGALHCVDSKGVRTQLFLLKRKWLFLQDNIAVELV